MRTLLASVLTIVVGVADARDWQVDPGSSTLGFVATVNGNQVEGHFAAFDADIRFDPETLDQAQFDVCVPLDSVDTGNGERDDMLRGAEFFAVAQWPKARFVTETFTRNADGNVTASGTLTLHGVEQPVAIAVRFAPTATGATLEVETTLNRQDFKLGTGDTWSAIDNSVTVRAYLLLR